MVSLMRDRSRMIRSFCFSEESRALTNVQTLKILGRCSRNLQVNRQTLPPQTIESFTNFGSSNINSSFIMTIRFFWKQLSFELHAN
jgi:hypothetical protein